MEITTMPAYKMQLAERPPGLGALTNSPAVRRDVQEFGIHVPFVLRPIPNDDCYEVLTQPERFVAAVNLGFEDLPVVVRDDIDEAEASRMVSSQYGVLDDNPIDDALWLEEQLKLQAAGEGKGKASRNLSRLARLTGRGRTEVTRALQLLELPEDVQDMIRCGDLPPSHARPLLKLKSPADQVAFATRSFTESLSLKALQKLVGDALPESQAPKPSASSPAGSAHRPKDTDLARLEQRMTELTGLPFEVNPDEGHVTIKYFGDLDTLQGLLERLGYTEH